jgi:hypothetical protein
MLGFNIDGSINHAELYDMRAEEQCELEEEIEQAVVSYLRQETPDAEKELTFWFKTEPKLTSTIMENYCNIGFSELEEF